MISLGLSGHFRLEVIDAETGRVTQVREFDNLITDSGLDSYGGTGNNVYYCRVGTGSTPPTPADTRMENPVGGFGYYQSYTETSTPAKAPDWVPTLTRKYRFSVGTAAGVLSEIGIVQRDEQTLWCRSLILNEQGLPEPLIVTQKNILDVYYTLRLHPSLTDFTGSFYLDEVLYNYTARASEIQNTTIGAGSSQNTNGIECQQIYKGGTLGTIQQRIVNYEATKQENTYYSGYPSAQPYVAGTFYRDYVQPFKIDYFNLNGGFDGMWITWHGVGNDGRLGAAFGFSSQIKLDKVIPKDSTNAFNLTLRTSWHRWEEPNP